MKVNKLKIHYDDWSKNHGQWVRLDSSRFLMADAGDDSEWQEGDESVRSLEEFMNVVEVTAARRDSLPLCFSLDAEDIDMDRVGGY